MNGVIDLLLNNAFTAGSNTASTFPVENFQKKASVPLNQATFSDDNSAAAINSRWEQASVRLEPIGPDTGVFDNTILPTGRRDFYFRPGIGCCKLQRWNKRSFMRVAEKTLLKTIQICNLSNPSYTVDFNCV